MNGSGERADLKGFEAVAKQAAEHLLSAQSVTIIGHIDADGVSASAIASLALMRAGIQHTVRNIKKLDEGELGLINADPAEALWLVDLGSAYFSRLEHPVVCVADHHIPELAEQKLKRKAGQNDLFCFTSEAHSHVNPHLYGIDGSTQISGSGVTYLIAKAIDPRNADLASIAVVGAVGDLQDATDCHLNGLNRTILKDGEREGTLMVTKDIRIFGRETRPVARMLQFSTDPVLPGLTNDPAGCARFLSELGLEQKTGDQWRAWIDLNDEERCRVASALCNLLLNRGYGSGAVRRLVGEVYILAKEDLGSALHDAKEYSTLLNSCGRYGKAEVGRRICQGDRSEALEEGLRLQQNHRGNLAEAIALVKDDIGVERRRWLQYFHGRDLILDSIVGIVAGMVLGSGEVRSDLPMIAFAYAEDGKIKVSARGTRELVNSGLDLAYAVKLASEKVGGTGGGHNIAAGATIAMGKEMDFLDAIEQVIASQLSGPSGSPSAG